MMDATFAGKRAFGRGLTGLAARYPGPKNNDIGVIAIGPARNEADPVQGERG